MPVSLAAGIAETAVSQLTGRHTEDAIGRLRVGRAPRQERATGASAIYAEQRARSPRMGCTRADARQPQYTTGWESTE
jgi:hypothetical protein